MDESEIDAKQVGSHITEVSKNARATWFGLLGYLAFSLLTLMNLRHVDLFKGGAGIPLPLVGISVEPLLYIVFGPPLLLTVHIYLHVHLMKLWSALPRLASSIQEQEDKSDELSERVYPWLIADFALRRGREPLIQHNPLSRIADWATGFLAWLAAPLMLLWFWQISTPLHNPWLTTLLGLIFGAAFAVSLVSYGEVVAKIYPNHEAWAWPTAQVVFIAKSSIAGIFAIATIVWFSFERTTGAIVDTISGGRLDFVAPINLRLAELSERPDGWLPFDVWMTQFEEEYRQREGIVRATILDSDQQQAFLNEAIARRSAMLSELEVPSYVGGDFREADFSRAFVAGADFRETDLTGASLIQAVLEGIDLRFARLEGTDFRGAQLQLANLSGAALEGSFLRDAQLQMANLRNTRLTGVSLEFARLDRALLTGALLEGALLFRTRLDGASLRDARLESADLRDAILVGADISRADFMNASLVGASLEEANCFAASFDGAVLDDADMRCYDLDQNQLRLAVGNENTLLPDGITISSCIEEDSLSDTDIANFGPTSFPTRRSFCQEGEPPRRFGG